MLTVYDFTGSGNGYKVWLLMRQLGLPYKRIERDILKGETRTPLTPSASPRIERGAASHSNFTPSSSALATSRIEPGMLALSRR